MPETITAFTKSAAIVLKEQIMHIKELCKHMEMEITIRDLMEKKAVLLHV